MKDLILSIDQGTTGTTVLILNHELEVLAKKNNEFPQHYPQAAWVEHDPEEIWEATTRTIREAVALAEVDANRIAGIGITNQRETTLIWDRETSRPIHNAIVWQDRRTAPLCEKLKKNGKEKLVRSKTGLVLDPYFSGTKIKWLLDNVAGAREKAEKGKLAFGTIDTFLVWRLTDGANHVTDVSNASRTLLLDLKTLKWDPTLLKIFDVPPEILPEVCPSSFIYGKTKNVKGLPDGIPIAGMAGDQQAALFGQACFNVGEAKCTYGTGSFLLMNIGPKPVLSRRGLVTTVAWQVNHKVSYALEGSSFIAGAAVQWLRDGLKIIKSSVEIEELARSVADNGGVYFVPALVGLGAPHWNPHARGVISGITRGTTRGHIARATLEGIAFQQQEILESMEKDSGRKCKMLKVDGGACTNNLMMQFQADILGCNIVRPKMIETTAFGAAFLAGLAVGIWKDQEEIRNAWKEDKTFESTFTKKQREDLKKKWAKAVGKA
ncbi:MAG: glycerol kinase GlpK [Deltaproteobacteria bacterium]|nr:glycerol kinase GlpK [Deltaproteobacteria bacterium]